MTSEQSVNFEPSSIDKRIDISSVRSIAGSFNAAVGEKQAKYSDLYSVLKSVMEDNEFVSVPDDIQQKAIIAMKSTDKMEKAAGQDALLFSQMKTILKTVDENFDEKRDTRKDREEMLSYALEYAVNNAGYFIKNEEISKQVKYLAELGVLSCFCNNMPFYLSDKPVEGIALAKEIVDFGNRKNFTKKELSDFTQGLSENTGISASDIVKEIQRREHVGGNIEVLGDGNMENTERKIDIEMALDTLDPRTKTVFKKNYGLRGRKQSKEYTAEELRVSRETVRQIEKRGIRQLKHSSKRKFFEGYH
jgi:RNA polymerase sigma factor (sigma-70 family)